MKILLLGGSGRLGQMLCKRLSSHDVTTLSRRISNTSHPKHISADLLSFRNYQGFDVVVNCAAMKDVAKCQENISECMEVNFMGTLFSLEQSIRCGVKRYVFISTDMATVPRSVYGISKMLADSVVVSASLDGVIQTAVVRLGNIISSEGSIFSTLATKAQELGYVPITDEAMTRFFMSSPRCADLIVQVIEREKLSGEIFAPRCKAYRIGDVARAVAPEVPHKIIGLRPGDLNSIVMVAQNEALRTQVIEDKYIVHPRWSNLQFSDLSNEVTSQNNFSHATVDELRELYNSLL